MELGTGGKNKAGKVEGDVLSKWEVPNAPNTAPSPEKLRPDGEEDREVL